MTYQPYVIAAYLVFVVVLMWDFVAPRIQIARSLRAARLRIQREKVAPPSGIPANL
ncbi:MAG: heme exporter protein CcmD [Pseudomonadota bacterium]|nr:heme exporter protein CcmD [Pseudomonadota bacterium]MDQ3228585.1 heme exporter protein CcmD [Pseudomonadota bacterium]